MNLNTIQMNRLINKVNILNHDKQHADTDLDTIKMERAVKEKEKIDNKVNIACKPKV